MCTSDTGPRGSDLKDPSQRTTFMVPEGAMKVSKEEKQPKVLPSYDAYEQYQQPEWHNTYNK